MLLNGVRKAAIATGRGSGGVEMEPTMAVSLRASLQQVSDPRNLDASVEEVFQLMLGVNCRRDLGPVDTMSRSRSRSPRSSASAACSAEPASSPPAALRPSRSPAHMTGMEFQEIDDTVKDGIGEICNMLAGAWKGKVPELAANCGLSVPAVITGRDYRLHVQAPEFQLHHLYRFEASSFAVTIVCDGLQ